MKTDIVLLVKLSYNFKKKYPVFVLDNRYSSITLKYNTITENVSNQPKFNNTENDHTHSNPSLPPILARNIEDLIKLEADLVNMIGTPNLILKTN